MNILRDYYQSTMVPNIRSLFAPLVSNWRVLAGLILGFGFGWTAAGGGRLVYGVVYFVGLLLFLLTMGAERY